MVVVTEAESSEQAVEGRKFGPQVVIELEEVERIRAIVLEVEETRVSLLVVVGILDFHQH